MDTRSKPTPAMPMAPAPKPECDHKPETQELQPPLAGFDRELITDEILRPWSALHD